MRQILFAIGIGVTVLLGWHYWFHLRYYMGQKSASSKIARAYMNGGNGFSPSYEKAREWLEIAGSNGDASAMSELAWMLETGRGGPVDKQRSLALYREAQKRGDSRAETYLRVRKLI